MLYGASWIIACLPRFDRQADLAIIAAASGALKTIAVAGLAFSAPLSPK